MPYVFSLAIFMIVVATRRKLASLGEGGVALSRSKAPAFNAWTVLGVVLGAASLLSLSPEFNALVLPLGENSLPVWMIPFTGGFVWFVLSLASNRW